MYLERFSLDEGFERYNNYVKIYTCLYYKEIKLVLLKDSSDVCPLLDKLLQREQPGIYYRSGMYAGRTYIRL